MSAIVLTADILARCTGARIDRAQARVAAYNTALAAYGMAESRLRVACLLANVGHESGGFAFGREIWNPAQVPAQAGYEGRADLGNIHKGDGYAFRGAGDLQITGRFNFAALRERLRKRWPAMQVPDFEASPETLAEPQWAALAACDHIDASGANGFADVLNFDGYCDVVNRGRATLATGDSNGFLHRLNLMVTAIRCLP